MNRSSESAKSRSHELATVESLGRDPAYAAQYLDSVLADGSQEEWLLALRRLSEAFSGVQRVATADKMNVTTLYRTLSADGNPELRSMNAMLKAMGMRLSVQPIKKRNRRAA